MVLLSTCLGCSFVSSMSTKDGGIFVLYSSTLLSDQKLVIINNTASEGVFLLVDSINATFSGQTTFQSNVGSLMVLRSNVFLGGKVTFTNNTASLLEDNKFRGGAITLYYSQLTFITGTTSFIENRAPIGGAIHAKFSSVYNLLIQMVLANC